MIDAIIDISHHNRVTSFEKVKAAGVMAVIHKATQGLSYVDPTYKDNSGAIKAGDLLLGAYHFGTAGDASAQAEYFLSTVGDDTSLLVLDLEGNPQGRDMSLQEAEQFVHHVWTRTGRYPGLYSGHMIKEMLSAKRIRRAADTELSKCWLWIAQYGPAPLIPTVWSGWTLWQHTDGAAGKGPYEVDGIGRCDRDYFNGTAQELVDFWGKG